MVDGVVQRAVGIEHVDGVITSVTSGADPKGRVLPGLTLHGLANAHSHAFHRALRGRTHADGGTFWTWREAMYALAARLEPDSYRRLATAVFAEMVLAGFTVVGEFHYLHGRPDGSPYEDADMERAILDAARDAGIRITLLDTLYLRGGLDADGVVLPLDPVQRRFSDGSVTAWSARRESLPDSRTALIGAAVHSIRGVDPIDLPAFRSATRGLPVHAHVSEQPAENDQVLAATGATPTRLFDRAGLVDPLFTAVHATHLSPEDIGALGRAGATACFCPTTERDLADGFGPASALVAAGAGISIGTDQHAAIDPFEEIRGVEMSERLASRERGRFSPETLLAMATRRGYTSLGWTGGAIAVGAVCDLVAVDTRSTRTAGGRLDQLWLAATAADVTHVVVDGHEIVAEGRHRLGDVGGLLVDAMEGLHA